MLKGSAKSVDKNSLPINTQKPNTVKLIGVKSVKLDGNADVYNMEVEDNHNFAVNGGLIVHNCMDSLRYFVKTMRIANPRNQYINKSIW